MRFFCWLIVFTETLIAPVRKSNLDWLDIFTVSFVNEQAIGGWKYIGRWNLFLLINHGQQAQAYCRARIQTVQRIASFYRPQNQCNNTIWDGGSTAYLRDGIYNVDSVYIMHLLTVWVEKSTLFTAKSNFYLKVVKRRWRNSAILTLTKWGQASSNYAWQSLERVEESDRFDCFQIGKTCQCRSAVLLITCLSGKPTRSSRAPMLSCRRANF